MDPPMPVLTNEQKEAIVREWAQEQMHDSRFMYLPADMARLLICYVRDAAIKDHSMMPDERAKEILWENSDATWYDCSSCKDQVVVDRRTYFNGDRCGNGKCDAFVCDACSQKCRECDYATCLEHRRDIQTCETCDRDYCAGCKYYYECELCDRKLCQHCKHRGNADITTCQVGYGCWHVQGCDGCDFFRTRDKAFTPGTLFTCEYCSDTYCGTCYTGPKNLSCIVCKKKLCESCAIVHNGGKCEDCINT
jgi:hypothetical protein